MYVCMHVSMCVFGGCENVRRRPRECEKLS